MQNIKQCNILTFSVRDWRFYKTGDVYRLVSTQYNQHLLKQANIFGHPCHWLLGASGQQILYSDVDFLYTYSQDRPYLFLTGCSKAQTDPFSVWHRDTTPLLYVEMPYRVFQPKLQSKISNSVFASFEFSERYITLKLRGGPKNTRGARPPPPQKGGQVED